MAPRERQKPFHFLHTSDGKQILIVPTFFPISVRKMSSRENTLCTADMSNVIEGAIDIDFLEVLTLTIDIELTILESLTLSLTLRLVNDCI